MDQISNKLKLVFNAKEGIDTPPNEIVKKMPEIIKQPENNTNKNKENNSRFIDDEELLVELTPEEFLKWDEYGNPYF